LRTRFEHSASGINRENTYVSDIAAGLLASGANLPQTAEPIVTPRSEPALYSIPDARRRAGGIGHTLAYELVAKGCWIAVKLGGRTLITADSLNSFIAGLPRANIRTGRNRQASA
jgi:hypothetical protein